MWDYTIVDDLQTGPVTGQSSGYLLNIRSSVMSDDLKAYVVYPKTPLRRFYDDQGSVAVPPEFRDTVFLAFPEGVGQARATSLGRFWAD